MKILKQNEMVFIAGGACFCECHHPLYGWGHHQSKKGPSLNAAYCQNILCAEGFWDNSLCSNTDIETANPLLSILSVLF